MLGLSVNCYFLLEGTLFFIFSFHPSSFSTIFFYICFLSSSSSSSCFPILSPPFPLINSSVPSYSFWTSLFIFFIHPLLFSLSSFNSNWFSSFFSLFFILTLLFLFLPQRILQFSSHTIPMVDHELCR